MGYIYILTNPDYEDIKVGYAKNVQQRLATLNRSTSLRSPFELYATYEVETELADKDLHVILDTLNPDLRKRDIVVNSGPKAAPSRRNSRSVPEF